MVQRRITVVLVAFAVLVGVAAVSVGIAQAQTSTPVVTGLSPDNGIPSGGSPVTVHGSGLSGATAVRFDGIAASTIHVLSDSAVVATAPPGTGSVDVTVQTATVRAP